MFDIWKRENEGMKVIICVKTVRSSLVFPDNRYEDDVIINPYDLCALNDLVELKSQVGTDLQITCLCMGPESAKSALTKCIAMGCDDAVLLSGKEFGGADTVATTYVLAKAIEKLGEFDFIVCGSQAVDGETGQVVFGLAERLNLRCIPNVVKIRELGNQCIKIETQDEEFKKLLEVDTAAVFAYKNFMLTYSHLSLVKLKKAKNKSITVLNISNLEVYESRCGIQGSKTKVVGTIVSNVEKDSTEITGTIEKKASTLKNLLLYKNLQTN